jgi:hypothetical protein
MEMLRDSQRTFVESVAAGIAFDDKGNVDTSALDARVSTFMTKMEGAYEDTSPAQYVRELVSSTLGDTIVGDPMLLAMGGEEGFAQELSDARRGGKLPAFDHVMAMHAKYLIGAVNKEDAKIAAKTKNVTAEHEIEPLERRRAFLKEVVTALHTGAKTFRSGDIHFARGQILVNQAMDMASRMDYSPAELARQYTEEQLRAGDIQGRSQFVKDALQQSAYLLDYEDLLLLMGYAENKDVRGYLLSLDIDLEAGLERHAADFLREQDPNAMSMETGRSSPGGPVGVDTSRPPARYPGDPFMGGTPWEEVPEERRQMIWEKARKESLEQQREREAGGYGKWERFRDFMTPGSVEEPEE